MDLKDKESHYDSLELFKKYFINGYDRVLITFRFKLTGNQRITFSIITEEPDLPRNKRLCAAYMVTDRILYRKEMSRFRLPPKRGPYELSRYMNRAFYAEYCKENGVRFEDIHLNRYGCYPSPYKQELEMDYKMQMLLNI